MVFFFFGDRWDWKTKSGWWRILVTDFGDWLKFWWRMVAEIGDEKRVVMDFSDGIFITISVTVHQQSVTTWHHTPPSGHHSAPPITIRPSKPLFVTSRQCHPSPFWWRPTFGEKKKKKKKKKKNTEGVVKHCTPHYAFLRKHGMSGKECINQVFNK